MKIAYKRKRFGDRSLQTIDQALEILEEYAEQGFLVGVWFAFYGAWREAAFLAVALLLPLGIVLAWTLWIRHRDKRGY